MLSQGQLLTLHGRLLAGDARAASQIVEATIAQLVQAVSRDVPGLHDRQEVEQACFDALFDYLSDPARYNPERAQLNTYLAVLAKGKALTVRRTQTRQMRRDTAYAEYRREHEEEWVHDEDQLLLGIELEKVRERFGERLFKDPGDDAVFALMASGEADRAAVARTLGLPPDAFGLTEAGKRVERMRGRIRRIGSSMEA